MLSLLCVMIHPFHPKMKLHRNKKNQGLYFALPLLLLLYFDFLISHEKTERHFKIESESLTFFVVVWEDLHHNQNKLSIANVLEM